MERRANVNTSNMGMFAIAAAIAFVGALWVGVPPAGLAPVLILLACPVMMIFMMKGMHGGGESEHRETHQPDDQYLRH
jgi:hypothetical protein